ncbi:Glycosyltransferase involved in cell wall bisynthesis [Franzmannia pantelleriensis]|uniref:Glycosyltransferase involved in cell wall bisynthesis n=1 Tax=Franzmannia pantelleriensis TaxID=48727 RepID=A0A1G9EF16_9GAMM|nr:glycosyltransferase [Halomonas pantelleriensis]SDK74625.1 Glycosyltransferase involved in cell wall bisynthesis [Halomonas pantelleriensis]
MPSDSKRILLVIRRLGLGGIEQATITLANALHHADHDVHLLVLKDTPQQSPAPGVTVHCQPFERQARKTPKGLALHLVGRTLLKAVLPGSGFVWQGLAVTPLFERFLAEQEAAHGAFDMILIRGQGAFELLWPFDDKRCWQMVEAVVGDYEGRQTQPRWLIRKLFDAKRVICVSQGLADGLSEHLAARDIALERCEVIHNAVPLERVRTLSEQADEPIPDTPFLLHVARLVPEKNPTLLIEAYHKAVEDGLDTPLLIIGEGSEQAKLDALVKRLGLEERVQFLGRKANPYPWMAKASALVLSSNFEGLGLVLIESLALGTQCIATDVPGGIREVLVDDQARLIAAPNAQDLAAKMQEALDQPVTVRPQWAERFSEDAVVPRFLRLIEPNAA